MLRDTGRGVTATAAMLLLFAAFAVLTLLQALYGAAVYERVVGRMDDGYHLRASLSYVANKLHAYDGAGEIDIEDADGLPVLCLWDEGKQGVTCVYFFDGALMEQYIEASTRFEPAAGQRIAELADFTFSEAQGGFSFTAYTFEGTMRTLDVRLRTPDMQLRAAKETP